MQIIKCIVKGPALHPEEQGKLSDFCAALKDGTAVEMKLSVWESGRSENASRYFHKLRDRYAGAMGYTRNYGKAELKHAWGWWIEHNRDFEPPSWAGEFVELYGKIIFMKSTAEYTTGEMNLLIEGTISSCIDNSIDIGDLVKEHTGGA